MTPGLHVRPTREEPLKGWRVLVTASRGGRLGELLRARGAEPLLVPTIATRDLDPAALDALLARHWDWIVVTSPNGARVVVDRLVARARGGAGSPPTDAKWAAVGPRTAETLRAAGIEPMVAPADGTGASVAEALDPVAGRSVLLPRARQASADLPRILRARGARVTEVAVYETLEGPESARASLAAALASGVDAIVFTSGSTVRGFARLAGDPAHALVQAAVVAIGPTTAAAARSSGLDPRIAHARTPEAIVAALEAPSEAPIDG